MQSHAMPAPRESGFQSPNFSSRKATPPSVASAGRRAKEIGKSCFGVSDEKKGQGRLLLIHSGQGLVGRTDERSRFIEDDGNRDVAQETFKFPLIFESVEKGPVLYFLENFHGDAAGDVDATEREDFQRQIPGLRAIDGGPEIQSVRTDTTGFVQTAAGHFRGGIGVRILERSVRNFRCEKFMKGAEAAAGKNEFPTDLRIAAAHEAEEFDLLLGVRSEIGMASFGGHHAVAPTVPDENRLTETGAGSEQGAGPAGLRNTRIQNAEIPGWKMLEAVAGGSQIIQENDIGDCQFLDERRGVDDPRKIRGAHAPVDHRSGDAEARGDDAFVPQMIGGLAREFLDDEVELREFLACKALLEDGSERASFFREKRQITLRAANVSRENHQFPPKYLNRFNESFVATTGCTIFGRRVRAVYRIPAGPSYRKDIAARWRSWLRSRHRGWGR